MSDAVTMALITAVPPTMAALATLVMSWRNGQKSDRLREMQAESKSAVAAISERVDGAATAAASQITALHQQVSGLRETVSDQKQVAAVLAAKS